MTPPATAQDRMVAVTSKEGWTDCVHRATAVAVDSSGEAIWEIGDPNRLVFERSTSKPFRALAMLRSGAAERYGFEDAALALVAGSHSGTGHHTELAEHLLDALELPEDAIYGEPRLPLGDDALIALAARGGGLRAVHGECSGEHIGALATCLQLELPIEGYWRQSHALQQYYREMLAELAEDEHVAVAYAKDRCGMPTALLPLRALTTRFSRLLALCEHEGHAARLLDAITRHPRVYTGHKRLIGDAIVASEGRVWGKCGAEGLYVIGWPGVGVSLGVKVSDGNHRAAEPVIRTASLALGLPWPSIVADHGEFGQVVSTLAGEGSARAGDGGW